LDVPGPAWGRVFCSLLLHRHRAGSALGRPPPRTVRSIGTHTPGSERGPVALPVFKIGRFPLTAGRLGSTPRRFRHSIADRRFMIDVRMYSLVHGWPIQRSMSERVVGRLLWAVMFAVLVGSVVAFAATAPRGGVTATRDHQ
jgi:hypothetical protein